MKRFITLSLLTLSSLIHCNQDVEIKPYSLLKGPSTATWSNNNFMYCYDTKNKSWSRQENTKKPQMNPDCIYIRQGKEDPNNLPLAEFKIYELNTKLGSLTCRIGNFRNLDNPHVIMNKIKLSSLTNVHELGDLLLSAALKIMKDQNIRSISGISDSSDKDCQELLIRAGFIIEEIRKDPTTKETRYLFVKNLVKNN